LAIRIFWNGMAGLFDGQQAQQTPASTVSRRAEPLISGVVWHSAGI
jgi:hypothetical protein